MRWVVVTVMLSAGCGRSGFDYEPDARNAGGGDGGGTTADAAVIDPIDAPPGAIVVTLGETPSSDYKGVTADTYLNGDIGMTGNNYGAATIMDADATTARALLKFTVTAIPPGKTIVAARLHLYSELAPPANGTIAPVLQDWTEGTGNATGGFANWTNRMSSQAWATAGAGSPGSSGAQIATVTTSGVGLIGIDLPAATVQGWVDTPATNFGMMIAGVGLNDITVSSSNSTTAANRPELVVTYLP